jgi:fructokinase
MRAPKTIREYKSRIAGMGLVALDVICEAGQQQATFLAGGTCGNVLMILSYLGWHAIPLARLGEETPAELVKADMARWGVDTSLVGLKPSARTPVVVEKLRKDRNGIPFHTFSFHCPECGHRLPGFQPVTANAIDSARSVVESADVFFVDRVSKSAILLAEVATKADAIVVFEPPSCDGSKSFQRMVELSHVVKYSHERIDELTVPRVAGRPRVEIQTLGRGGLRFRTRLSGFDGRWQHLQAEPVDRLADSAGAGDWLTAGFLFAACRKGRASFDRSSREVLLRAFSVGQTLAAWNSRFVGARGGMYSSDRARIPAIIARALACRQIPLPVVETNLLQVNTAKQICLSCSRNRSASATPGVPTSEIAANSS